MPVNTKVHHAVDLKTVVPLPINERTVFSVHDVCVYIRTVYNLKVGYSTVVHWIKKGMKGKDGNMAYLVCETRMGKRMVTRENLEAFLSAT